MKNIPTRNNLFKIFDFIFYIGIFAFLSTLFGVFSNNIYFVEPLQKNYGNVNIIFAKLVVQIFLIIISLLLIHKIMDTIPTITSLASSFFSFAGVFYGERSPYPSFGATFSKGSLASYNLFDYSKWNYISDDITLSNLFILESSIFMITQTNLKQNYISIDKYLHFIAS